MSPRLLAVALLALASILAPIHASAQAASAISAPPAESQSVAAPSTAAADALAPPPTPHVHLSPTELQTFLLHRGMPVYPPQARAAHISGDVVLDAVISPEGKIAELHVVSGPEPLRQAALDCARQWTYRPYLDNGNPIFIDTTLTVNFFLMH